MTWISVSKARKGKNQKKRASEVHDIADKAAPDIATSVQGYFSRAKSRIKVSEIESILGTSHKRNVTSALISDSIQSEDVSQVKLGQKHKKSFVEAAESWRSNVPELKDFQFNKNDPSISKVLARLEKERNQFLEQQSRKTVRQLSVHGKKAGFSDRETARLVKLGSNLNSVQSKSLIKLQNKLIKEGVPKKQFNKQTADFIARSEAQRAKAFAANESIAVVNEAQVNLFQQAADAGVIQVSDYEAVWDATMDERTSHICESLNNKVVPFGGTFSLPGVGSWKKPPAHGYCRSLLVIRKKRKK